LRRLIYFLKSNPGADESGDPGEFRFAWAERVLRLGGALRAENIQAPVCAWDGGRLGLRGVRLPERKFTGYAYRIPAPAWFAADGRSPPSTEAGPGPALERQLHATPFGRLCRHPEVRLALAQDRLASTLAPLLAVPDLLADEDRLFRDWEVERPAAALQARASCGEFERSHPKLDPTMLRFRIRLRCAALRRIDIAAVGREVFRPCPAYFGEPHLLFKLPRGLNLKAGMVRMANSWPMPETEAASEGWRSDSGLVVAAENCLFPLPPPEPGSVERFSNTAAEWLALEPLRAFQARAPLPLFPHATVYPNGYVPRGFRIRISPGAMRDCGGSYLTLAAAGLSPYIAEPFDDYCRGHGDLLSEWVRDVAGLAAEKWGRWETAALREPRREQSPPTTPGARR
jgi:hypothetical protein